MFKRVNKRLQKQQKDEELGLDADTKAALGLQDDSDSDDFLSSDSDTDDSDPEDPNEEEGGEEHLAAGESDEEDEVEDEVDESDADEPPVSLTEALKDPLYTISFEPEIKACVSCPGRLLKNPTMEEVHRSSNVCSYGFRVYNTFSTVVGTRTPVQEVQAGRRREESRHRRARYPQGDFGRA